VAGRYKHLWQNDCVKHRQIDLLSNVRDGRQSQFRREPLGAWRRCEFDIAIVREDGFFEVRHKRASLAFGRKTSAFQGRFHAMRD
jgi:hypothetical protein